MTVQRDDKGRIRGGALNPTGKGGFQTRPHDRGSWTGSSSPTRLLRKYGDMTPDELREAAAGQCTALETMIINHLLASLDDSKVAADIINRLDGTPRQTIDQTINQVQPPVINITTFDSAPDNRPDIAHDEDKQ